MKKITLTSIYIIILSGICRVAWLKPGYNWDILPYAEIVLQYDHAPGDLHRQVYSTAARELPTETYSLLISANGKRKQWAADANAFDHILPFYAIKPLYTFLSFLFYKSGMTLFKALGFPSVIAYFFSGVLLFIWLSKFLPAKLTFVLCLIIMLLPNLG